MPLNQHPVKFFEAHELTPREQQVEVIDRLFAEWDRYNYFALNLPTGIGKTYIATALAASVKNAYILTSTLQLQTQYEKSWTSLVNLKGRGNYECRLNPNFTVDAAPCSANPELLSACLKTSTCAYYNQKNKALSSQSMITNPVYMLYSTHCGFAKEEDDEESPWVKRSVLIIDEAHNLENHLVQFAESDVNVEDYEKDFGLPKGRFVFTGELEKDYLTVVEIRDALMQQADELAEQIKLEFPARKFSNDQDLKSWAKGFNDKVASRIKKLNAKAYKLDKAIQPLKIFFNTHSTPEELSERWLISKDPRENKLKLAPIYGDFLFQEYFGKLADKFVFLSATLGSKDAFRKELGIESDQLFYLESDSPFPPGKSPVIVMESIKLSKNVYEENASKVGPLVDSILDLHPSEQGIIHSVTYDLQTRIFNGVSKKNQTRLICRDQNLLRGRGEQRKLKNDELIAQHSTLGKAIGSVLLSPSMMEGVDLHDDLSRFQVIIKLPWANLGDARVKVKSQLDGAWYTNKMWMSVLQASGRSTRHEEDSSITYVLDSNFKYFYEQWERQLPAWFKRRLVF